MKKIYFAILALAALTLASCEKEPIGGTAVEAMSGQWHVQVDGYDLEGDSVVIPDFNFEAGYTENPHFVIITYNNAANDPNKLYISDRGEFWEFTVLADCDLNTLTFGSKDSLQNEAYDCKVKLTNGKIVKNGTKTPSGAVADYIQFDITFSDDDLYEILGEGYEDYAGYGWGDVYGFNTYRISGWRYTGLAADED